MYAMRPGAHEFRSGRPALAEGESQMMENRRLFLFAAVLFIIAVIGYILGA